MSSKLEKKLPVHKIAQKCENHKSYRTIRLPSVQTALQEASKNCKLNTAYTASTKMLLRWAHIPSLLLKKQFYRLRTVGI